jgi:hypothetical protein
MRRAVQRVDPNDEQGVIILIVALSLVVVFGMSVLVVDLGGLIVKHRGLVNANDSAAIAAAASFARNEAQVVTNEGPAQAQADAFATDNVPDAIREKFSATIGISPIDCSQSQDPDACGTVEVGYESGQALFFGPAIGLGDQVTAHGAATAVWGPAGGAQPSPIVVHLDWLTDTDPNPDNENCAAPVPNSNTSTPCAFWLGRQSGDGDDGDDGDDEIGAQDNSQWAWINLNPTGWNTPRGAECPDARSADLRDWIAGRDVPRVRINPVPTPTFVCTTSGDAADHIEDLRDEIGHFKIFPVNDGQGDYAPPGQVDRNGDPCPRDQSCTPGQYNVVGFTVLKIDDVLRGDDDEAIGDPGGTFRCSPPISFDFDLAPPNNTFNLETQQTQCDLTQLHWPNDPSRPYPRIRPEHGSQPFDAGLAPDCTDVDYCYDADTHVITWLSDQPADDARVDWDFFVPPSPGKCGIHQRDRNAVCLVVSWQGYRTGGINPGGGVDFGLRSIRLSA